MPDYGKLSKRPLDEMVAGARIEVAPYKRDPMDFVLWKPSKPGEPAWPSPAGITVQGRPGWHIECSAMSWKHLGDTFDIHGGGIDLVFPHHENEIAQSRCAFHTPVMANVWMHNGFLQVEGAKMSKSEGNFVTIRELLTGWKGWKWPGAVLRFAMLGTHYRQPIDWTQKRLEEAAERLSLFRAHSKDDPGAKASSAVLEALADDLNTPQAIAELNGLYDRGEAGALRTTCKFLGLDIETVDLAAMLRAQRSDLDESAVQARIDARNAARKEKNFKEADRIRDELAAMGVVLKDSKDGTTWEIAR
jgi:cysteinyl-tRNA synthetase